MEKSSYFSFVEKPNQINPRINKLNNEDKENINYFCKNL